ncbi:hypothetical protein PPEP_b0789 [Pseudoalteromonas peptidolytica F12-50-A1]|uniref:Iron transporter n=1 Tax=Pseudoalteromonas peptidolytica F12-50-A1 TaxID=1315280 RepID=A0A8I0N161_9GAMM|nr:hypothetical protein [Pseudoalteromonas peptidolytica F12-50-A1]NLR16333.1 hypothetical protein [Pseudoalteromonas peptidolytica]RXF04639.1 hypothetical protein D9603_05560 [Pseudoalteromonas sp. PS5]GEK10418.1 hypothetical protein PPE03_26670 [Pseudoalteromonas peptidolytica]
MPNQDNTKIEAALYKSQVISRFLIAIIGGYFVTVMASSLLALTLPIKRLDALLYALTTGILFYPITFIWVFGCRSFRKVLLSMIGVLCILYGTLTLLGGKL